MLKSNLSHLQLILVLLKLSRKTTIHLGYTLMELLVVVVVIGVLSGVVVSAKPWYENPLKNSQDRLQSVIKAARTRAMTSTSTYRITSNPNNPNEAIQIQRIRSGSCQANATLQEDVADTDLTIAVDNIGGFAVGDRLLVGDTEADVLSVNFGNRTITLGAPVGAKTTGTKVETIKDWKNDGAFLDEDLNVNKKNSQIDPDIRVQGKFNNTAADDWAICVNSRGLVSIFDGDGMVTDELDLVLTNTRTNEETKVVVFPGGAMETTAIAMGSGTPSGGGGTPSGGGGTPPGGGGTPPGGGGTPGDETPGGETPGGETPVGETPVGETPVGETPVGETPVGETPVGETPVAETPVEEKTADKKQKCDQGLGNGSDGCSPGNSDKNQVSNDDCATAAPGSPCRGGSNDEKDKKDNDKKDKKDK